MTTSRMSSSSSIMTCYICNELFTEPKILPCAHTVCRNCLLSWIATETQCPICCSDILNKQDLLDEKLEDWVSNLPTDIAMEAIVEVTTSISRRGVCPVCEHALAVCTCVQCGVVMCEVCRQVHSKLPVAFSHTVIELTAPPSFLPDSRPRSCSDHPDLNLELFCLTHNVPVCCKCASSTHGACPEVAELNEIVEKRKKTLAQLEAKLTAAENEFKVVMATFESHLQQAEKNRINSLTYVDTVCDRLQRLVESFRERLKKNVTDDITKVKSMINERVVSVGRKYGIVTSHRLLIERVQKSVPSTLMDPMAHILTSRVQHLNLDTSFTSYDESVLVGTQTVSKELFTSIEQLLSGTDLSKELWCLNPVHSTNISLRNKWTGEQVSDKHKWTVLSSECMLHNMLYEIQLREMDLQNNGTLVTAGIVAENPAALTLPWKQGSVVRISENGLCLNAQWTKHQCGLALRNITLGSRVGVLIDTENSLHLFVQGIDQGIAVKDVRQPCYAMFEFSKNIRKEADTVEKAPRMASREQQRLCFQLEERKYMEIDVDNEPIKDGFVSSIRSFPPMEIVCGSKCYLNAVGKRKHLQHPHIQVREMCGNIHANYICPVNDYSTVIHLKDPSMPSLTTVYHHAFGEYEVRQLNNIKVFPYFGLIMNCEIDS